MTRSRSRTTKWNLFFHYAATILALISGIVLVPLYLRFIPHELYGAWLATGNILGWLTIIDPGLSTVLQQRSGAAYGKQDVDELNALLTNGILLSAGIATVVLVAGLYSSRFLINWLNLDTVNAEIVEEAFRLGVVGTSLVIFSYGITAYNQGMQSSVGIGIVYVVTTVGSISMTVVLLYQGVGLLALPIGIIIRGAGLLIGNIAYVVWRFVEEKVTYSFSISGIGTLCTLSSYSFLGRGAGAITANLDAFVLTRFLGPELALTFVLTRKAPDFSRAFLERPAVAFMPAISTLAGTDNVENLQAILLRLLRMILWLLGLVSGAFLLFNDDFVNLWVGSDFYAGNAVNLLIVLTTPVAILISVLSNLCFALGNIKGNSTITFIQSVIAIPLVLLGAKYWGLIGVAMAPLIAMLAISSWYYPIVLSRLLKLRRSDIRAMLHELVAVTLATVVAMGILFGIITTTWATFVLAASVFGTVYVILLTGLSPEFRSEAIGLLQSNRLVRRPDRS